MLPTKKGEETQKAKNRQKRKDNQHIKQKETKPEHLKKVHEKAYRRDQKNRKKGARRSLNHNRADTKKQKN
jgi:hypothetical protein